MITFSMESPKADVYAESVQLSLFETELQVKTPKGSIQARAQLGRGGVSCGTCSFPFFCLLLS